MANQLLGTAIFIGTRDCTGHNLIEFMQDCDNSTNGLLLIDRVRRRALQYDIGNIGKVNIDDILLYLFYSN